MAEITHNQNCGYVVPDKPGLYKMRREIKHGKSMFYREVICHNPAFGIRKLDEWEQGLMLPSQDVNKRAA
jgi:hypothetical protein